MNKRGVEKAIKEAKRFLEIAEAARKELDAVNTYFMGSKRSAAVKRASMDLTRSLADMRKPG